MIARSLLAAGHRLVLFFVWCDLAYLNDVREELPDKSGLLIVGLHIHRLGLMGQRPTWVRIYTYTHYS
jgi:hypothetical protein